MKGHNFEHGKKEICKKCGKIHFSWCIGQTKTTNKIINEISKKMKGRKFTKAHCQKISDNRKGIKFSEEHIKNLRKNAVGWSNFNVIFKNKNLEKYKEYAKIRGHLGGPKGGKITKEKYGIAHYQNLAFKCLEINRKNKPYKFLGVFFDSNAEKKIAEWLFFNLNFVPIEKENTHIRIGNKEIDFLIFSSIFLEYHHFKTIMDARTKEQYYDDRREILNKNGYAKYELIVFDSLKTLEAIKNA